MTSVDFPFLAKCSWTVLQQDKQRQEQQLRKKKNKNCQELFVLLCLTKTTADCLLTVHFALPCWRTLIFTNYFTCLKTVTGPVISAHPWESPGSEAANSYPKKTKCRQTANHTGFVRVSKTCLQNHQPQRTNQTLLELQIKNDFSKSSQKCDFLFNHLNCVNFWHLANFK